jgi:hypothetical protein
MHRDVHVKGRDAAELQPLGVQEMFGEADHVKAEILGHLRQFGHFLDHPLNPIVVMRDRAQPDAFLERGGNSGKKEAHEFHGQSPPRTAFG